MPTLADKLDHMIKTKLLPNAGKTKVKTVDDEVRKQTITHLQLFRNNSKSESKLLMNILNFIMFSNTLEVTSLKTHFKKT